MQGHDEDASTRVTIVSFAAIFQGVMQRSPQKGALRDNPKDVWEGD